MSGPWISGVQISRTAKGQTPVADFYCGACRTHRRVTGRDKVTDFMRANPITDHRATCRPTNKKGTTST
ncbi:transcription factor WhiB [Streptomyces sp. PSKA54]|uniref:Transcription factor WhiB n=1 Tax=Streptomyces himalayensis subsp. aureolus TaxID=2758039 RepID=A0A7W2D742_9ACTN|nr:transcription factor WhiB [Streptomyces himalayensis]MBA4865962.1 transcription factor WhiB [Streptomyces himalayensis subsp. aureolus]